MCADVRICDRIRINLATHHKRSAPDPEILPPITGEKCRDRLLRNASHDVYALIYLSRVSFKFSHRRVIRLSRFGMLRVRQLDPPNIAELRRPSCARKQDRSRPAGFYSEAEGGSPRLRHRV